MLTALWSEQRWATVALRISTAAAMLSRDAEPCRRNTPAPSLVGDRSQAATVLSRNADSCRRNTPAPSLVGDSLSAVTDGVTRVARRRDVCFGCHIIEKHSYVFVSFG